MEMDFVLRACPIEIRVVNIPGTWKKAYLARAAALPGLIGHGETPDEAAEDLADRVYGLCLHLPAEISRRFERIYQEHMQQQNQSLVRMQAN